MFSNILSILGLIFCFRPGLILFFQPGLIFFSDWCGDSPSRANYSSNSEMIKWMYITCAHIYEIRTYNKCPYILCSSMSSHVLACLYICKVCIWVGAGIALQGLITQVYHIMNETIHTILNSEAMDILNSGPTGIHHTSTHTHAQDFVAIPAQGAGGISP